MEVTLVNIRKLQITFDEAWKRIREGYRPVCVECDPETAGGPDGDFWTVYMNHLDVLVIDEEDLLETFDDMVNFGSAVRNSVCLRNPCNADGFLLVDRELAHKSLVLGALP